MDKLFEESLRREIAGMNTEKLIDELYNLGVVSGQRQTILQREHTEKVVTFIKEELMKRSSEKGGING